MKHLFTIACLLTISMLTAQNANRKYIGYSQRGNSLEVKTSDGHYQIQFYSADIVETTFIPSGEKYNSESHAVVLKGQQQASISDMSSAISLSNDKLEVRIQKQPFQITYYYNDTLLLSEKIGYTKGDVETIDFNLTDSEILYGGGARVLGMNRRGNRLQLYNRAHYGYETRSELMNFTMPIVMSSKLYAVHFDNAAIGYLDLDSKKTNTLTYETNSGRKTYQVIAGNSWQDLITNYTALTGRQPMPPRWAFGNFASRFGYHSQAETEMTIAKFRSDKIPVDAIILDLYWFGKDVKGTMGNLEVFRDSFPKFEQMTAKLLNDGVKTITITEPFILTTSSKWQEAVDKKILATDSVGKPFTYDFYFGNTGLIDIFKPEGRNWFWNIYKDLAAKGVAGNWGDLGEPEVHPSALRHETGTADELHNIYGHNWAKLIFDGYKRDFPNQRPFILMRSGYSGSQRFGMIPWSGDVSRSWGGLSGQPEIALQMGMQGMAYMHSDLGGFAGANLDNELYIRWLQYGVFQPVFRPHAQEDVASEPVFKDAATKALAKKAIELRYRMLPYNYTLAFENNQTGTPLMRPLFFNEPFNTTALNTANTYLWGNDFLVAPVMQAKVKQQQVYFPSGSNWFDFYSSAKYHGGTTSNVNVAADHIPVFVRGGALLPTIDIIQTTRDYSVSNFKLDYYFDPAAATSTGKLYHDDGTTPDAFEKGQYELLKFTATPTTKFVNVHLSAETGNAFTAQPHNVGFTVHHLPNKPRKVFVNGRKAKFRYDKNTNQLQINVLWQQQTSTDIKIQLTK